MNNPHFYEFPLIMENQGLHSSKWKKSI